MDFISGIRPAALTIEIKTHPSEIIFINLADKIYYLNILQWATFSLHHKK